MKKVRFKTENKVQTAKLGELLAKTIVSSPPVSLPVTIALIGELGSGKTTFAQGFAQGLGIHERILSPTFILMRRHAFKGGKSKSNFQNFFHFDLYRLNSKRELKALGWKKVFLDRQAIILIEWADRIKRFLPSKTLLIHFSHKKPDERVITFSEQNF
mgnify:CR=1 FL=1